jgi:hypothetical protein
VTVVGICAVWEAVRLLQEWRIEEEEAAAAEDEPRAAALPPPPVPRMRRLLTCALLRWSCFTFLTLSLIFFRLRFNDHKPARCRAFHHTLLHALAAAAPQTPKHLTLTPRCSAALLQRRIPPGWSMSGRCGCNTCICHPLYLLSAATDSCSDVVLPRTHQRLHARCAAPTPVRLGPRHHSSHQVTHRYSKCHHLFFFCLPRRDAAPPPARRPPHARPLPRHFHRRLLGRHNVLTRFQPLLSRRVCRC